MRVVDKIMVEIIHFPNNGEVLRRHYTFDSAKKADENNVKRYLQEYPDFAELVMVKGELAAYLRDKFILKDN